MALRDSALRSGRHMRLRDKVSILVLSATLLIGGLDLVAVLADLDAASGGHAWRPRVLATLLAAVGALLLALLGWLWRQVVRTVLQPIDTLAETARAISRGEAPAIPGLERDDELGALARALTAWQLAHEDLVRASRHKSDFLASISHELRTPLNSILGFAELMLDRPSLDPARAAAFTRHIHNSGSHLLALIDDLLDLAKVEAGQMDLRTTTFDLAGVIDGAVATVEPLAHRAGLVVTARCPGHVLLEADADRVRQVLLNLLANAIKFTPPGGRVTVDADRLPDRVVITVADTGIGIPEADQERIFEAFLQLDDGCRGQRGTGLGLALTRRLVELHGGRIRVHSRPGEGSQFAVELPWVQPTHPPRAIPALAEPASETA